MVKAATPIVRWERCTNCDPSGCQVEIPAAQHEEHGSEYPLSNYGRFTCAKIEVKHATKRPQPFLPCLAVWKLKYCFWIIYMPSRLVAPH